MNFGRKCIKAELNLREGRGIIDVKLEVWARDKGECVICHSKENLHFDHDLTYFKGGTSFSAANLPTGRQALKYFV